MTRDEFRVAMQQKREEKANANRDSEQQGGSQEWIAPGVVHGAGRAIPDEVPQPQGDE
jgi:hypothetical protein